MSNNRSRKGLYSSNGHSAGPALRSAASGQPRSVALPAVGLCYDAESPRPPVAQIVALARRAWPEQVPILGFAAILLSLTNAMAQTPSWSSAEWNLPGTLQGSGVQVFEPVEVFPRAPTATGTIVDPGQPPIDCPTLRPTGIRGFSYDNGTPLDPNDDREYMVVGRSDGILFVDATPPRDANPGSNPGLPAHPQRKVVFIGEPLPAGATLHPLSPLNDFLNGLPDTAGNLAGIPYCPPVQGVHRRWSSIDTTNREVAIYRSPVGDYFIYSVNTWRAGLWVIKLVPNAAGELVPEPANPQGVWQVPMVNAPTTLGAGHNIDVDPTPGREAIFVTDDHHELVVMLDLATPAMPGAGAVAIVASGENFHDAMVYRDHLWVSSVGSGGTPPIPPSTRVFALPIGADMPVPILELPEIQILPPSVLAPCGHSTYVDVETPFVEGRLYTLREDDGVALTKRNLGVFGIDIANLASAVDAGNQALRTVVPYVLPYGVLSFSTPPPPSAQVAPVHNLRGIRRTGFVAMYRDGIGLVDLFHGETEAFGPSDPSYFDNKTLGSFDTTVRQHHVPIPPPGYPQAPPAFAPHATVGYWTGALVLPGHVAPGEWDKFLGAWDIAVHQDSGLVYAPLGPNSIPGTAGQERMLTAGVFRVCEGHINRYWDATPFPSASPNQALGLVPKLVSIQGPPRQGKPFMIGDENAGRYAAQNAQGQALRYEYTLIYSDSAPVGVGGDNPATAPIPVAWDPDPSSSTNNSVWLNVWDPLAILSPQWVRRQGPGAAQDAAAGWFYFPTVGSQGQRWYCQLLVEEYVVTGSPPAAIRTGRFAASRGHWFGVARQ